MFWSNFEVMNPTDKEKKGKPTQRKPRSTQRRNTKNKKKGWFYNHPIGVLCFALAILAVAVFWTLFGFSGYHGEERWIYVPQGSTNASIRDSLTSNLGLIAGNRTYVLWRLQHGQVDKARGIYRVEPGERALGLSRRLLSGRQTPVKFSFNNARTVEDVARKVAAQLELSADDFMAACDSLLPEAGFTRAQFPAAFFPDTYESYITASGADVVNILLRYRNRFWNDERRAKAKDLGITPVEAATIASIVEEESGKLDERPVIARLYLNRLQRGIRLQADPTVKFSTGNFALRRITHEHLRTDSPYNTYLHDGLPPGPIRVASKRTIEDMLEAPQHDYLYMCAKDDFSGYHNFASDYATHLANARRYQQALNKRGIK